MVRRSTTRSRARERSEHSSTSAAQPEGTTDASRRRSGDAHGNVRRLARLGGGAGCVVGALRRADPQRRRLPQRRPRAVGHAGWAIPGHREVGLGRRRAGAPRLRVDAGDGRAPSCRSSRRSRRSTSTTPSPPTIWPSRASTRSVTSGGAGRSGSSTRHAIVGAGLDADLTDGTRRSSIGPFQSRSNAASATSLKPCWSRYS